MISRSFSSSLLALVLPASMAGTSHAASLTFDADMGTTGAQDGAAPWNTVAGNNNFWNGTANVAWPNTNADEVIFGAGSGAADMVTVGTVIANKLTFGTPGSGNYSLSSGTITLAGTTPTLAVNNNASISSNLAGTAGMTKSGSGALTLSGTNNYTGGTSISGGSVTFAAGGSTGGGTLALGTATGSRAAIHMNSTGTLIHNTTVNVGGAAASANGAGAIKQTAGTVSLMNNTGYMQLGNGGYGSYDISGGTVNFTNASGVRIGDNTGGLGSWVQTGGTVNMTRFFVVGGNSGTAPVAVATFTGGTINSSTAQYYILGNAGTATGTMNVGTLAGGAGTVVCRHGNGITMADQGNATGILNLNSGTVQFNTGVIRKGSATGTGIVNLNGATLKSNVAGLTLLNNSVNSANVYNGGVVVDTQAFATTISAPLLATTGSGIYPAGGVLNLIAPDGAGYIGAPLVSVTSSGTGTGASAVANVVNGQVTGVTLTCPGQGYNAGDTVTFAFAGGGSTTPAANFVHTLTAGNIAANGTGGLTKLGSGTLTLSGANTFNGPLNLTGNLIANDLTLNNTTVTINGFNPANTTPPLQANTTFTTGGTVQVAIDGVFSTGSWPLIYYPSGGSIGGSGISALQIQPGSLPRGVVASLVDNIGNGSVDLNVTSVNPVTWKGNISQVWDINTTSNWAIGATPEKYQEDDIVVFNDSATGSNTNVILNTTVQPQSVTFDNNAKNYSLAGTGSIGGSTPIVKSSDGTVTILNANATTGATTVNAGTLQFGDGATNGSVAGPLVNNANVVFNPAGSSTLPGDISGDGAGVFAKTGPGTQVLTPTANTSAGIFSVQTGTLQFGNTTKNGALGGASYELAAGTTLHLDYATAVQALGGGWASKITGPGLIKLSTAQAVNGTAFWGPNSGTAAPLAPEFTGTLEVNRGRFDSNPAGLGGTSKIVIHEGAQFLAWAGNYSVPIEIAGNSWGETGYPGALRLAGATTAATWNGSVTLTADSGIMVQRATNFTIAGAITGPYLCEFSAGDPSGENGIITVAPAVAGQNTYAATRINGRPNGSVVAASTDAFSTGPLEVVNAILKLDGHDQSFANLSGAGGAIGNYNAATPSTLTVGSDNSSTSYAGVLRDGAAAPLALTKTGTGTLTLTAVNTYTGNTTVTQGKLALATASLADTSTVTIGTGAVLELNAASADTIGSLVLGTTTLTSGIFNASHPVYGSYFSGTGSLIIGGAYDSWAASKGLDGTPGKEKGPTDDPDKDGIQNLTEFYLDGNPLANDQTILPVATLDATYLTLTFKRRDDAEGDVVTQAVQYGSILTGWTDVLLGATSSTGANGVIVTIVENDAAPDSITVQIPKAGAKLFGRLNIVR